MEAKYQYSRALSRWCCSSRHCHADRRLHAWHLHLFVSYLKTLNLEEKFEEAHEEPKQWIMPPTPSHMERQVKTSFSLVASEIERSLGVIECAKEYLEVLLRPHSTPWGWLKSISDEYRIVDTVLNSGLRKLVHSFSGEKLALGYHITKSSHDWHCARLPRNIGTPKGEVDCSRCPFGKSKRFPWEMPFSHE